MMGDVYENASNVLIWLGDEDSTTESGYQAINTILNSLSDGSATEKTYLLSNSVWIDALKYFESTWFRRLWPVQGVVRSSLLRVGVGVSRSTGRPLGSFIKSVGRLKESIPFWNLAYGVPSWVPRYDLGSHVTMALASSSIRGCDAELQA
jgi:hypothetical protein